LGGFYVLNPAIWIPNHNKILAAALNATKNQRPAQIHSITLRG